MAANQNPSRSGFRFQAPDLPWQLRILLVDDSLGRELKQFCFETLEAEASKVTGPMTLALLSTALISDPTSACDYCDTNGNVHREAVL